MYNILVVEDEYLSREGIKSIIKENFENSVELFEAENGIKAKNIIDENNIDAILLDVNIPGINGIDLCKYIKSKSINQKIIVITAYDDLCIKNKM
ncbi:MAG: response regulator, partial [Peptostreptococcaceae bacterium]